MGFLDAVAQGTILSSIKALKNVNILSLFHVQKGNISF